MAARQSPINTQQRAKPYVIPAPIGGLNGRDGLAVMDQTDAYEMYNILPGTTSCNVMPGCTIFQANCNAPVTSLEVFAGGATQKIIAFAGANVIDVTVNGTQNILKSGIHLPQTQATMFSTVADSHQFLIITTGQDTPMSFDGTAITNLAITGLNEPDVNLNFVCPYQGRLFWGTVGKLGFYFLPPGQIQGAASWFDLGQMSVMGGYLQAIATYSDDAGNGPNDYIVFISSRGEYFMYQGIDPSNAADWTFVGRYRGGGPIGRKCVIDYAGDILILTTTGVQQFSQIRKYNDIRYDLTPLSAKLGDILLQNNVNKDIWGWCMQLWPAGGMLIINTPVSNSQAGQYYQFAMNTITQAWGCRNSREWDAICFCMSDKQVYFGRYDGSVRLVGGLYDNGNTINFSVKQAYNSFQEEGYKLYHWAQFLVRCDAPVSMSATLAVDYKEIAPPSPEFDIGVDVGAAWDTAIWDQVSWGYGLYTQRWIAAFGNYGFTAAHWLIGSIGGATLQWFSTEHVYEKASGLL